MLRRLITWAICGLMFAVFFMGGSTLTTNATSINVPDDYLTIQEAIDAADPGSIIYVSAGIYYEHLKIDKALTLQGEGRDTTIINGSGRLSTVSIEADWVNITGFTITNGWEGISLSSSSSSNITGNDVMCNGNGIALHFSSNNNFISGNKILSNLHYSIIFFSSSDNNIISSNNISNNGENIGLLSSSNNNITNNNISNNLGGIHLSTSSNNNTVTYNNISSNYIEGIGISKSSNNNIVNNIITYNGVYGIYIAPGIILFSASNNIIKNNNLSWNTEGITLYSSLNNNISCNDVSNNHDGFRLHSSSNNTIYHNNIITNRNQAWDSNPINNNWHHPKLLEGNYWSDYKGVDNGSGIGKHAIAGDGIGDTLIPHPNLDYDYYPFTNKNGWIITTIEATINIDPNTLNLKSKGRWITGYITLNSPYVVNNINISTVILEDTLQPEWGNIQNETLMVKFDRSEVEDMLSPGTHNLKVAGKLTDGTKFEGYSDEIRVIEPP